MNFHLTQKLNFVNHSQKKINIKFYHYIWYCPRQPLVEKNQIVLELCGKLLNDPLSAPDFLQIFSMNRFQCCTRCREMSRLVSISSRNRDTRPRSRCHFGSGDEARDEYVEISSRLEIQTFFNEQKNFTIKLINIEIYLMKINYNYKIIIIKQLQLKFIYLENF